MDELQKFLEDQFNITVQAIHRMTTGVGGETYAVETANQKYVFKAADTNEMNHPESEPEICNFLREHQINVSKFYPSKNGEYALNYHGRCCHLQEFVKGTVYAMNTAPDWFMKESPVLLGRIHCELNEYPELPVGIGKNFFYYMTPENAKHSYQQSLEKAKQSKDYSIIEDLEYRIQLMSHFPEMNIDVNKLTYRNSHGDYTVNQILCDESSIKAVIDWTCACRQPVVWELTRSFFYAERSCVNGELDEKRFQSYVDGYLSVMKLNAYDIEYLLKLYYYQLAVCNYYNQYQNAEAERKDEYLTQAKFATKVLKNLSNSIK